MKYGDTKKIKVAQVTTVDIAIQFLLSNQIKALMKSGYDVIAVCSADRWTEEIREKGISLKGISMTRSISPFPDFISLIKLIVYFHKEKFDIVHTHTPKAGLLGTLAAKFAGIPIIVHTNHGFYFHDNSRWIKRKFFVIIEKIVAFSCDLILSVDKEDIDTAEKEGIASPRKMKYLGGWVDLSRFSSYKFSEEQIRRKKEELGIAPNKKVIGIVARLVEEKGYLDLFRAMKHIIKEFPDTVLLAIGPQEPKKKDAISREAVKDYGIEENVLFLGARTDVDELFAVMDIFTLPSWREGIGISLLEASAMGLPIVSTDVRGCREAVDAGVTGILVRPHKYKELRDALLTLLRNPEGAQEMGEAARKKIEEEFDEDVIVGKIKAHYERLIKEKL